MSTPTITVVVPTRRRPDALSTCLGALEAQDRRPDEVVVVHDPADRLTTALLDRYDTDLPLVRAEVDAASQVRALNRGLEVATGAVVAITDDDTRPRSRWLAGIEAHLAADPGLGGVGGRDVIGGRDVPAARRRRRVGRVEWSGRIVGNHHLGCGPPREVEILKGANMAFRREALGSEPFDTGLIGRGAELHNDLAVSLAVRRRGWRLLYDPDLVVDHHADDRGAEHRPLTSDGARASGYNTARSLRRHLPRPRAVTALSWGLVVGTRASPGLVHGLRAAARRDATAVARTRLGVAARLDGWRRAAQPS